LIDIVIVNWNAGDQLSECLSSIQQHGHAEVERVIVVDNASSDESADRLEERFDLPIQIIRNDKNLGFARACNQGARAGSSPYLLFLNPDAEVFKQSISRPLQYMEAETNAQVGICGVQLVDEAGAISRTCARFPSLVRLSAQALGLNKIPGLGHTGMHMKEWDHSRTSEVDQVMGAFFLIRRKLFEALGGFDERYFVYFEEVDLSFRARALGYKSVYLADTQAFHAGGGTSRQVKAMRLFYSLRSRLVYGFKHFPHWQAWTLVAVIMLIEPITRLIFCALHRDREGMINTLQGYRFLWKDLPRIVARKRQGGVE
jgi:GT2 family glycosyltransferase